MTHNPKPTSKAQLTVFVILGIVMLFLTGMAYFLLGGRQAEQANTEAPSQAAGVEKYITSCLQRAANKAMLALGRQGGWRTQGDHQCNPDRDCLVQDSGNPVAFAIDADAGTPPSYPYDGYPHRTGSTLADHTGAYGQNALLPRNRAAVGHSLQEQLEAETLSNLSGCINFARFPGLTIKPGTPVVNVSFGSAVVFWLNYTINVSTPGSETMLSEFVYKAPVAFIEAYDTAAAIIARDVQDNSFDVALYTVPHGWMIARAPAATADIINITTNTSVENESIRFQFARRNRRPALECIDVAAGCHGLQRVIRMQNAQAKLTKLWNAAQGAYVATMTLEGKDCSGAAAEIATTYRGRDPDENEKDRLNPDKVVFTLDQECGGDPCPPLAGCPLGNGRCFGPVPVSGTFRLTVFDGQLADWQTITFSCP
ncbi:hypothetical protein HY642_00845 [Candidatus Woesearchaeota archaeon]|nr:hypothetical protein [Candidatus Woesearchaeota archaeon]